MFMTSLSASSNTTRSSKQLHFDPGKIAVNGPERLRYTTFTLHSPLVLEVPTKHRKIFLGKLKCVATGPHHRKTDPLEVPWAGPAPKPLLPDLLKISQTVF